MASNYSTVDGDVTNTISVFNARPCGRKSTEDKPSHLTNDGTEDFKMTGLPRCLHAIL